jgi:hypothetical protein
MDDSFTYHRKLLDALQVRAFISLVRDSAQVAVRSLGLSAPAQGRARFCVRANRDEAPRWRRSAATALPMPSIQVAEDQKTLTPKLVSA